MSQEELSKQVESLTKQVETLSKQVKAAQKMQFPSEIMKLHTSHYNTLVELIEYAEYESIMKFIKGVREVVHHEKIPKFMDAVHRLVYYVDDAITASKTTGIRYSPCTINAIETVFTHDSNDTDRPCCRDFCIKLYKHLLFGRTDCPDDIRHISDYPIPPDYIRLAEWARKNNQYATIKSEYLNARRDLIKDGKKRYWFEFTWLYDNGRPRGVYAIEGLDAIAAYYYFDAKYPDYIDELIRRPPEGKRKYDSYLPRLPSEESTQRTTPKSSNTGHSTSTVALAAYIGFMFGAGAAG